MVMRSEWHGDSINGIEVRYIDDEVDEVVLFRRGKSVCHLEFMSDSNIWMGLYSTKHMAHVRIGPKKGAAKLECIVEGEPTDI